MRQRYDLPVYVANDAHAATLGEYTFGAKTDAQSLIVVLAGRGIRAGIVLDGALYYGEGYGAGEIGHVVVDPAGDLCVCGHRGCLEAMASTKALVRQARAIVAAQPASIVAQLASAAGTVTTDVVLEAYAGRRSGGCIGRA